ncbi:MAG: hypothetical protein PHU45_02950 [Bacilli bacterium]|nr:hypothetical protein [Bacilli bacterium]
MFNIIEVYIKTLTKEDVNNFALNNNINLSASELDFTYNFVKNNYQDILAKPNSFNFSKYQDRFSSDNYFKIEALIKKYSRYL